MRKTKKEELAAFKHIDCAHYNCYCSAIVRQKTNTGWANLCHDHYLDYHQQVAESFSNGTEALPDYKMMAAGE